MMGASWRRWFSRALNTALFLLVAYLFARVYLGDALLGLPGIAAFEQTDFGHRLVIAVKQFAADTFGDKSPGTATADYFVWWIQGLVDQISNIKIAQLLAAGLGALSIALINLLYNWWRNVRVRQMCSAQLYVTAIKLVKNLDTYREAKEIRTETVTGKEEKHQILVVNADVRAALHRLRSELELIQDFSIAYDYAFWRRLREIAARLRMQAMSVREAIDVIVSESDRAGETVEIDLLEDRNLALVVRPHFDGITFLGIGLGLETIVAHTLLLAEKLELGFLFQWLRGSGESLPPTLKGIRSEVRTWLEIARKQANDIEAGWLSAESEPWPDRGLVSSKPS